MCCTFESEFSFLARELLYVCATCLPSVPDVNTSWGFGFFLGGQEKKVPLSFLSKLTNLLLW